jgi:O-antigen ligase
MSDRSLISLQVGVGPGAIWVGILVLCLAGGWAVAGPHSTEAAALAVGVGLLAVCYLVEWLSPALLGIALASFADPDYWPQYHGVKTGEFLLALLFTVWALRRWPLPRNRASRIASAALAILVVMEFLGVVVAHEKGVALTDIMHGLRPALYYAAFWPLLAFSARPDGRRQVFAIAGAITFVVSGLMVLQITSAAGSHQLFLTASGFNTLTTTSTGFLRIRPAGLELIFVVGIFSVAYLIWGRGRRSLTVAALAGASLVAVALSLNRNMLIGAALGFGLVAFIVPRGYRVLSAAAAVVSLGVLLFAAFGSVHRESAGGLNAIATRVASVGDYQELKRTTLDDRFYENHSAIATLRRHPILGIGWDPSYGAKLTTLREGVVVEIDREFIHQQYLWLWLRTGLAGLLAFLVAFAAGIWSSIRSARRHGPAASWEGAGAFVSLVALGTGGLVATYFSNPNSIVVLLGVLALAVAPSHVRKATF